MNKKATRSIAMLIVQIASILIALIVVIYIVEFVNSTRERGMSIPKSTLGMAKTGIGVRDITGFSIDDNSSDIEGFIITGNRCCSNYETFYIRAIIIY